MARWLRFLVVVVIGALGAMYYGWWVDPVKYTNTTPETLRADYRADYVLMVAEAYHAEGDINLAVHRLALLGDRPPSETVADAITFASQIDPQTGRPIYPAADLSLIQGLATGLKSWNPLLETTSPFSRNYSSAHSRRDNPPRRTRTHLGGALKG